MDASVGELIRDSTGFVLGAFSKKIHGSFTPFVVEFLAPHEGLLFAQDSGIRVSFVESDSLNAASAVNDNCPLATEFPILNNG